MKKRTNYNEPVFDPFGERGATHYHPVNDAAIHYVALQLIYRDIARLHKLYSQQKDRYTKKLICKYVIIELLSLDTHVIKLVSIIISGKVGHKLNSSDLNNLKIVFKQYKDARKPYWTHFEAVRNKLGAHRESLDLLTVSRLWNNIGTAAVNSVLKAFAQIYSVMMKLNVYEWYKEHQDGIISFVQPIDVSEILPSDYLKL